MNTFISNFRHKHDTRATYVGQECEFVLKWALSVAGGWTTQNTETKNWRMKILKWCNLIVLMN